MSKTKLLPPDDERVVLVLTDTHNNGREWVQGYFFRGTDGSEGWILPRPVITVLRWRELPPTDDAGLAAMDRRERDADAMARLRETGHDVCCTKQHGLWRWTVAENYNPSHAARWFADITDAILGR